MLALQIHYYEETSGLLPVGCSFGPGSSYCVTLSTVSAACTSYTGDSIFSFFLLCYISSTIEVQSITTDETPEEESSTTSFGSMVMSDMFIAVSLMMKP